MNYRSIIGLLFLPWHSYRVFKEMRPDIRRLIDNVNNEWIVFDIGANKGLFSWNFITRGCRIVVVEPILAHSLNMKVIRSLASLFGTKLVYISKAVVPDDYAHTKVSLYDTKRTSLFDSFQGASLEDLKREPNSSVVQANCKTVGLNTLLDHELLNSKAKKVLIKMDIEGTETLLVDSFKCSKLDQLEGALLIETHEKKYPGLTGRTVALKKVLMTFQTDKFTVLTDWI